MLELTKFVTIISQYFRHLFNLGFALFFDLLVFESLTVLVGTDIQMNSSDSNNNNSPHDLHMEVDALFENSVV